MAVKESLASAPTPFSLPLSFSLSTPIGLWEGAFGNRRSCHEYVVGRGRRCHFARRIQFLSNATSLPFRRRAPPSFGETARNFSWRRPAAPRPSVRPSVRWSLLELSKQRRRRRRQWQLLPRPTTTTTTTTKLAASHSTIA